MRDAEPPERFQEARRSELRAIVGGQRYVRLAAVIAGGDHDLELHAD